MLPKSPKLPLTDQERRALRKEKITLAEVNACSEAELSVILGCSVDRAGVLRALAEFQQVPSVGIKAAEQVVYVLGLRTMKEIAEKSGEEWLDELEQKLGVWTDPCVEDTLRCIVYHAKEPGSTKQWYDFTEERKSYRSSYGYPVDRPAKAWYE
ncbi:helix-hairpin-helix domain-containing protein [Alteribacillus sp. HJP-4]|uniref:helix-hairpin-helix domain-containing protein n=1 Tax=Alteribacillus sp. HJP-4 TaxID=2775394 RepID=UPI0035CD266F